MAHFASMSRFKIILSAGVCAFALSGCVTAGVGLALTAASLVTGGGDSKGGQGFRNPIDRHTTGRQVREALSQLDEGVDPACKAQLDEYQRTHGTLRVGAPVKPGIAAAEGDAATPAAARPPVDLLAKLHADEKAQDATDSAVSADSAAGAQTKMTDTASAPAADELPVTKASLGEDTDAGPGHCENRFVCLPGTHQPTIMLMCPGKGKPQQSTPDTTVASSAGTDPVTPDETPAASAAEETAVTAPSGEAAGDETAKTVDLTDKPDAPGETLQVSAPKPPAVEAPVEKTIERGGVADWNWSYDPSKQL